MSIVSASASLDLLRPRSPASALNLEGLDLDHDDLVPPDFYFEWIPKGGQEAKERQDGDASLSSTSTAAARQTRSTSINRQSESPSDRSSPASSYQSRPAHASSTSVASLGARSPPQSSSLPQQPRLSSGGASEASSSDSQRIYGGRRTFQRVASAPLERAVADTKHAPETAELSPMQSTSALRANTITNARSFQTPGNDRVISVGSSSALRRTGGLSRFGGPARRVVSQSDHPEIEEEVLAELSGRERLRTASSSSQSPPESTSSAVIQSIPGRASASDFRPSPPPTERPFRPFSSSEDQENRAPVYHTPADSSFRLIQQSVDRGIGSSRPVAPLQGSRLVHNLPTEHHTPSVTVKALEPAPRDPPRTDSNDLQSMTLAPAQNPPGTAPVAVNTQSKRSFLVNGSPYERIGILGKGGSSKVYSVLCPNTRIIYALKRVALDRADAETYQSYTNEIELLKRLRGHDRIIQLVDHQITFSTTNRPKVLMMLMECGEIDFATLLDEQRGKALNMNFVGLYWEQMLEAVHAVHLENVVHTDLKPANFVLVKGRMKIIDFGIAKAIANDTVNIQRDQQVGTVNYMSPEAIQRMNNQKVLKLSYPSDIWSLGCILYQMIYGSPPFQHVGGGPLAKMNVIADPNHRIEYPERSAPRPAINARGEAVDMTSLAMRVVPAAIDAMKRCLVYRKEQRLTIPELLQHEFLKPKINRSGGSGAADSTSITKPQMRMLIDFIMKSSNMPALNGDDVTAEDLFEQLQAQNALTDS